MKNKSKSKNDVKITLLCHSENRNRLIKILDDKAFIHSLLIVAGNKEIPNSLELKIGVVSDSNINDK